MPSQLKINTSDLQTLIEKANGLPPAIDITTSLAELNAANGGTAATTIGEAVNNTEEYTNEQEILINQIKTALENKTAGMIITTASSTVTADNFSISFSGINKEPKLFIIHSITEQFSMDATKNLACIFYNGTTTIGISGRRGALAPQIFYSKNGYTWTYSNETLTVSSSSGNGEFTKDIIYLLTCII